MTARFTLHGIWLSGPTYKVGLMLTLCGEPFDYVHVNLREGEHKQPGYLARQRFGQVPLLVDTSNGRHLCQSAAILEYLADRTGKFGGATLEERLDAREWMFWEFDRLAAPVYRMRGVKLGFRSVSQAVAETYHADGVMALKVLDEALKGRSWLAGEGPSIADIDVYGVAVYAPEGGFDLSKFPSVQAWMKRVEGLPGFAGPRDLLPTASRPAA